MTRLTLPARGASRIVAVVGAAGVLLLAFAAVAHRTEAFQSYLFVWWFLLGIPLGSLAILMVHNLTGGGWGESIRPALDVAVRLLPLSLALAVPLLFGLHDLYVWSRPDAADDPLLRTKAWYLDVDFFVVRNAIYFAVWLALAHWVRKWSFARVPDATFAQKERLRAISAIGLLLYGLTVTFAAIDWIMSLMPQWYSTTFGFLTGIGQTLCAFSFAIVCAAGSGRVVADAQGTAEVTDAERQEVASRFHDLGNLLLMFVMTWAYLAFTQYLIIWAEDLPNEIAWYLPRVETSWRIVALCLVAFHFALPLLVLLSRRAKRAPRVLGLLAALLVLAHLVDTWWLVVPAFRTGGATVTWTDPLAVIGLGGLWLAAFLRSATASSASRAHATPAEPLPDHG
ncbi:MAG TPA: hypothetical protein VJV77_11135 [Casimicrobiaceae bacterium]|nr:hypothetical protein [Casimicrobiaceae bacterium]